MKKDARKQSELLLPQSSSNCNAVRLGLSAFPKKKKGWGSRLPVPGPGGDLNWEAERRRRGKELEWGDKKGPLNGGCRDGEGDPPHMARILAAD